MQVSVENERVAQLDRINSQLKFLDDKLKRAADERTTAMNSISGDVISYELSVGPKNGAVFVRLYYAT